MKTKRVFAILLIAVMMLMSLMFVSCGTELAASAGGIKAAEEQQDVQEDEQDLQEDEEQDDQNSPVMTYILNTNTRKFHYPDCKSVKQMKDKNKKEIEASREEIIAQGFDPCGNCHP